MEPVEIVEDGLLLRPWRPTDAPDVHRACQDAAIQRWTTVPSPYQPEHALRFVTEVSPADWAAGTGAPFAVCDATSGELLGSCGLVGIDRRLRSGEIGYWTAPWARGRGVAVRATRAVARWAFEALDLRRMLWQAETGNHGSRLVALRSGFRVDGQLRLAYPAPGGGVDGWIGSLLPGEVPQPGTDGSAAPGSFIARHAAVFGRPQPTLFTSVGPTELRLRPLEEHDLDAVVASCRDPETIRWTTLPDPYQRVDAEWFHRFAGSVWARGTGAVFVFADEADDYLGSVELRLSPTDPLLADVGFVTAPPHRGRGYLPAALTAMATWAFTTLGLARVQWRANVGNTASRRAAEKAGFVFEGTARGALEHRGARTDAWVGALLPGDLA